jgi:DNA-binding response OmpR family regulator
MLIVEDDRKATRILAKGLDQEESAVHVGRTGEER